MSTSKITSRLLGLPTRNRVWRVPNHVATFSGPRRTYSSTDDAPPPPLLKQLKGELKAAMKAKDANRLSVLRSILSATTNAAKSEKPVKTDVQLVALIRKTKRASLDAAAEFRKDGRGDMAEKEEIQAQIMDGYIAGSSVRTLSDSELREMVESAAKDEASGGFLPFPEIMKKLIPSLEGYDVDKKELAKTVKELIQQS